MTTQQQGPPAGWYPHPSMAGTQRYWDGSKWTDHTAPVAVATGPSEALIVLGYITAVLMPPVGFVIGVLVTAKGKTGPGVATLAISVLVFALALGRYA
jgi:hypothetical protein